MISILITNAGKMFSSYSCQMQIHASRLRKCFLCFFQYEFLVLVNNKSKLQKRNPFTSRFKTHLKILPKKNLVKPDLHIWNIPVKYYCRMLLWKLKIDHFSTYIPENEHFHSIH